MSRRIVIGTDDRCDLIMQDEEQFISPRHCEIWRGGAGQIMVQDLGSTNGTWIQLPMGGQPARLWKAAVVTPNCTLWLGARTALSHERLERLLSVGFDL